MLEPGSLPPVLFAAVFFFSLLSITLSLFGIGSSHSSDDPTRSSRPPPWQGQGRLPHQRAAAIVFSHPLAFSSEGWVAVAAFTCVGRPAPMAGPGVRRGARARLETRTRVCRTLATSRRLGSARALWGGRGGPRRHRAPRSSAETGPPALLVSTSTDFPI